MENTKESFENNTNAATNIETQNTELPKQIHQHNTAPQYYPFIHQHPQILNKSHAHQLQSPLLLNVHPGQQLQYQTTHRHFQHYPQYINNSNDNSPYPIKNQFYLHQHNQTENEQFQNQTQNPWTPQPLPQIHFHQEQQQNKEEVSKEITPRTNVSQPKLKDVNDKKKSGGNSSQLRCPCAKRPPDAPVTMQGWLHKQGSEGLMLWKKRWFVLSEYCLFYYKGLAEEKLLGSILLPSYEVSVCGPEDKVNKKFAFKCEHANMRTYILAADSQELMLQWIHVLNLACNLQNNAENKQHTTSIIKHNTPIENMNTNFHQQIQQNNFRKNPIHTHTSSNTTDLSNSSQQELNQYNQHLYANAPPKPRRLNDTGYSSPSPEMLDKYAAYPQYISSVHGARMIAKSPVNIYREGNPHMQTPQPECMHVSNDHVFREIRSISQNVDRRTPDTYGRSKINTKFRNPSDYEDIYADHSMYKRPLSPVAANNVIKKGYPPLNAVYKTCIPVNMLSPKDCVQYGAVAMRKSPVNISRPHSADFLEYKVHQKPDPALTTRQQPRPKSSLDINKNSNDNYEMNYLQYLDVQPHRMTSSLDKNKTPNENDNYFYSQETYAEKMRKSAQYLHKTPIRYQSVDNRKPNLESQNNIYSMRPNRSSRNFNDIPPNPQPVRSRSVLSENSLLKEFDGDLKLCAQDIENESISPDYSLRQEQYGLSRSVKNVEHEQFARSASARLSHGTCQDDKMLDDRLITMEGERKREESMKRLLEWKQRMLQSPLNRKTQGNRGYVGRPESYLYQNCYMDKKHKKVNLGSRKSVNNLVQYNSYSSDDEASGSISLNARDAIQIHRDTFPRAVSAKNRMWPSNPQNIQAHSVSNLDKNYKYEKNGLHLQGYCVNQPTSQECNLRNSRNDINNKMSVSAGELLGRTHEELVLLLIQLRRQSAQTFEAIESCYNEIDTLQAQCHMVSQAKRIENLQKLEQIKQNLIELEKQYEKGKPLVNLVDNMVKLGSLYRIPSDRNDMARYIRDRLEFNQHIQERRLIAEEKREWNRLDPNHVQLQQKVQQLYQLDRLIQEESENLQSLQQDKEDIERALGGLRCRLNQGFNNPEEIEQARRQQVMLENELSRVHLMLAENSKKLEETVAGNARLEQELLVLKQKLQISRQQRSSPQFSNAGDSLPFTTGTSALLESDLQRVQKKIGDLQKQREELSLQVRQLTDRSNNLQAQQKVLSPSIIHQNNCTKKKPTSIWRETDLDTMNIIDHGDSDAYISTSTTPLYINTDEKHLPDSEYLDRCMKSSDSTSDDTALSSSLLEKQEIKTVRIVKRESERRQRDREKSSTVKCDTLLEEDDSSQNSSILFRPTPIQKLQGDSSKYKTVPGPTFRPGFVEKSPELSPIFKSEAARQIITEVSVQDPVPKQIVRRTIPREKRRHYTAPNDNFIAKSLHQLPIGDNGFDKLTLDTRRARDDLDIERALRQRIDAPDIVRSTLSSKELKYNEETIDNILSTPNKIIIPERYIPEQLPQLTAEEKEHRLKKVESIKKMLSDTAIISSTATHTDDKNLDKKPSSVANKVGTNTSMTEEKKQREHLLQLNQILAKQVMEMSKVVAGTSSEPDET